MCVLRKDTRVKFSGSSPSSFSTPCNRSETQKVLAIIFIWLQKQSSSLYSFSKLLQGPCCPNHQGENHQTLQHSCDPKPVEQVGWPEKKATVGKVAPNKRDSDINHSYWVYTFLGVRKMLALICFVIPGNSTRILAPCPVGNHGLTCWENCMFKVYKV